MKKETINYLIDTILEKHTYGNIEHLLGMLSKDFYKTPQKYDNENYLLKFFGDLDNNWIEGQISSTENNYGKYVSMLLEQESVKNEIRIRVSKNLIRRNIYNKICFSTDDITKSNLDFISRISYVFNKNVENENIIIGQFKLKNIDAIFIDESNLNTRYNHKYGLFCNDPNLNSYIISSKSKTFKSLLDKELTSIYSKNIFNKNFSKLNKKELDLLKIFLI